jgi:hypothetical protein
VPDFAAGKGEFGTDQEKKREAPLESGLPALLA